MARHAVPVQPKPVNVRPLLTRIVTLSQRPRGTSWSPQKNCDCGDCMRFRAIAKLARVGVQHLDGTRPKKRKRAKR